MSGCKYRSSRTEVSTLKLFLKISQNSHEKTCVGISLFNKVAGFRTAFFLKMIPRHRCFFVNFANF